MSYEETIQSHHREIAWSLHGLFLTEKNYRDEIKMEPPRTKALLELYEQAFIEISDKFRYLGPPFDQPRFVEIAVTGKDGDDDGG